MPPQAAPLPQQVQVANALQALQIPASDNTRRPSVSSSSAAVAPPLPPQKVTIANTRIGKELVQFLQTALHTHSSVSMLDIYNAMYLPIGQENDNDNKAEKEAVENLIQLLVQVKNSALGTLRLRNTPLRPQHVKSVIGALAAVIQETKLRALDVTRCAVDDDGATLIAMAMHHCYSLQWLNLSANRISPKGVLAIAERLPDSSITRLDLSGNPGVCGPALTHLARYLPHSHLKHLSLRCTGLDDAAFAKLCAVLPQCRDLELLDVSCNSARLGQRSLDELAAVINQCPKLTTVNFSQIDVASLEALGNALSSQQQQHVSSSLQTLDLRGNMELGDDTVRDFMKQVVHANSSLRKVMLEHTAVSLALQAELAAKLGALHDQRSKIMIALVSPLQFHRLGVRSRFAHTVPRELVRMLGDML